MSDDHIINEQSTTGWLRTELRGDIEGAKGLIHAARKSLGALRVIHGVNERIAAGEPGGFFRKMIHGNDGVTIEAITNNGNDTIRVFVPQKSSFTHVDVPAQHDQTSATAVPIFWHAEPTSTSTSYKPVTESKKKEDEEEDEEDKKIKNARYSFWIFYDDNDTVGFETAHEWTIADGFSGRSVRLDGYLISGRIIFEGYLWYGSQDGISGTFKIIRQNLNGGGKTTAYSIQAFGENAITCASTVSNMGLIFSFFNKETIVCQSGTHAGQLQCTESILYTIRISSGGGLIYENIRIIDVTADDADQFTTDSSQLNLVNDGKTAYLNCVVNGSRSNAHYEECRLYSIDISSGSSSHVTYSENKLASSIISGGFLYTLISDGSQCILVKRSLGKAEADNIGSFPISEHGILGVLDDETPCFAFGDVDKSDDSVMLSGTSPTMPGVSIIPQETFIVFTTGNGLVSFDPTSGKVESYPVGGNGYLIQYFPSETFNTDPQDDQKEEWEYISRTNVNPYLAE